MSDPWLRPSTPARFLCPKENYFKASIRRAQAHLGYFKYVMHLSARSNRRQAQAHLKPPFKVSLFMPNQIFHLFLQLHQPSQPILSHAEGIHLNHCQIDRIVANATLPLYLVYTYGMRSSTLVPLSNSCSIRKAPAPPPTPLGPLNGCDVTNTFL